VDLAGPDNGDQLAIASPYNVTWRTSIGFNNDAMVVVALRCETTRVKTRTCVEAARFANVPNNGRFVWTPDANLNDGAFYRLQLLNTRTMDVGTSGTFTFSPYPVAVDTRWARHSFQRA
jgi:hypothetical protein